MATASTPAAHAANEAAFALSPTHAALRRLQQPVKVLRILFSPDHPDLRANACFTKHLIEHHGYIDLELLRCRCIHASPGDVLDDHSGGKNGSLAPMMGKSAKRMCGRVFDRNYLETAMGTVDVTRFSMNRAMNRGTRDLPVAL